MCRHILALGGILEDRIDQQGPFESRGDIKKFAIGTDVDAICHLDVVGNNCARGCDVNLLGIFEIEAAIGHVGPRDLQDHG